MSTIPTLLSQQYPPIYFLKCFRIFYFSQMLSIQKALTYFLGDKLALNR